MEILTQQEKDAVKRRIKEHQEWREFYPIEQRCRAEAKKIIFEGETDKEQSETKKPFWKVMDIPTWLMIEISIRQATQKYMEYLVNIGEVESTPKVQRYLSMTMTHYHHRYKNKVI
jgi:hypothetical protein